MKISKFNIMFPKPLRRYFMVFQYVIFIVACEFYFMFIFTYLGTPHKGRMGSFSFKSLKHTISFVSHYHQWDIKIVQIMQRQIIASLEVILLIIFSITLSLPVLEIIIHKKTASKTPNSLIKNKNQIDSSVKYAPPCMLHYT